MLAHQVRIRLRLPSHHPCCQARAGGYLVITPAARRVLALVLGSQLFPRPGGAASEGGVGGAGGSGGAGVGAGVGGRLGDGEQHQQQQQQQQLQLQQQQPLPSLLSSLPAVRLVEGGPQFYNPNPDPDRNTNAPWP